MVHLRACAALQRPRERGRAPGSGVRGLQHHEGARTPWARSSPARAPSLKAAGVACFNSDRCCLAPQKINQHFCVVLLLESSSHPAVLFLCVQRSWCSASSGCPAPGTGSARTPKTRWVQTRERCSMQDVAAANPSD